MSALLVDTHIWLWYAEGNAGRLPPASIKKIDEARAKGGLILPGEPHGDPADRFLIATARVRNATLGTRDEQILEYGKAGHVRVLKL